MIVTITIAGLCGLILLVLSTRVVAVRRSGKVSLGDGGNAVLLGRIRAHANFVEYVPIILILMGLIEFEDGSRPVLGVVGIALVICRIAHAFGMGRPGANFGRMLGTTGTFIILAVVSLWALIVSAQLHHLF